jgi:hypothetical protein
LLSAPKFFPRAGRMAGPFFRARNGTVEWVPVILLGFILAVLVWLYAIERDLRKLQRRVSGLEYEIEHERVPERLRPERRL